MYGFRAVVEASIVLIYRFFYQRTFSKVKFSIG